MAMEPERGSDEEFELDESATRRLSRIGSHNCNWDSIESDDLLELLVDAVMSHRQFTLVGVSGMTAEEIDQAVAAKEAEDAIAAAAREALARRDAAVAKLEAAAEAYLSANVPSIPTLSRLQDLEAFYNVSHAIPPRPLPPYRELPLSSVRFDYCMDLFHQNVKDLPCGNCHPHSSTSVAPQAAVQPSVL